MLAVEVEKSTVTDDVDLLLTFPAPGAVPKRVTTTPMLLTELKAYGMVRVLSLPDAFVTNAYSFQPSATMRAVRY